MGDHQALTYTCTCQGQLKMSNGSFSISNYILHHGFPLKILALTFANKIFGQYDMYLVWAS